MKKYALNAQPRTELGKKSVKALRSEGKIPAVINGGALVELSLIHISEPTRPY